MKYLFILTLSLMIPKAASAVFVEKKEWFSCQKARDCVVVGHACGKASAINRKFQEEFETALGPSPFDCSDPPPHLLYKADCKHLKCILLDSTK